MLIDESTKQVQNATDALNTIIASHRFDNVETAFYIWLLSCNTPNITPEIVGTVRHYMNVFEPISENFREAVKDYLQEVDWRIE